MRPLRRIPLGHEADLRLDLLVNLTGHYAWEVRQVLPPPTPRHRKGQEVQRGLGMYGQDCTVAEEDGRRELATIAAADRERARRT